MTREHFDGLRETLRKNAGDTRTWGAVVHEAFSASLTRGHSMPQTLREIMGMHALLGYLIRAQPRPSWERWPEGKP